MSTPMAKKAVNSIVRNFKKLDSSPFLTRVLIGSIRTLFLQSINTNSSNFDFENHFLLRSQGQKNLRSALTLIRYIRDRKIETTYTTRRRSTALLTFGHGEVRNQKEVYEGHIHYAPQRIKYPVQSFTHLQISISQEIMFEDFKLIWKIIDPLIISVLVVCTSDCRKIGLAFEFHSVIG